MCGLKDHYPSYLFIQLQIRIPRAGRRGKLGYPKGYINTLDMQLVFASFFPGLRFEAIPVPRPAVQLVMSNALGHKKRKGRIVGGWGLGLSWTSFELGHLSLVMN